MKDRKKLAKHLFGQMAQTLPDPSVATDQQKALLLLARLFLEQRALADDPSPYKVALCPRRAGKSYALLVYALAVALRVEYAQILIVARVRKQVKRTFWLTLNRLNREFGLNLHFRNNELEAELPNGSMIYLAGADTQEEIDKFRGTGYDLVVVDECKSFPNFLLQELMTDIIEPALLDTGGTVVMIGTPGPVLAGAFYAVTTGDLDVLPKTDRAHWTSRPNSQSEGGKWSRHGWTLADNTAKPEIWQRALKRKKDNNIPDDDPTWQREMLARWVPDGDKLVYAFGRIEDDRCHWVKDPKGPFGLPEGHSWRYVLGVDLGHHDATAFVVAAWSETSKALYFVHVEKHQKLHVGEIAEKVKDLEAVFGNFDAEVIDTGGLGKTIAESLNQMYGFHFQAAKKTEKNEYIRLMNADMLQGKVKLDPSSELADEYQTLTWAGPDRKKTDPKCQEDLADGGLYTWRFCYHHYAQDAVHEADYQSPAWWKQKELEAELRYRDQLITERETPWLKAQIRTVNQTPLPWNWNTYKA